MVGDGALGGERRGEHQPDVALLEHVGGAVAHPRLRPRVGHDVEAEGAAVEVRGLAGVAHPELDVVGAEQDRRARARRRERRVRHTACLRSSSPSQKTFTPSSISRAPSRNFSSSKSGRA